MLSSLLSLCAVFTLGVAGRFSNVVVLYLRCLQTHHRLPKRMTSRQRICFEALMLPVAGICAIAVYLLLPPDQQNIGYAYCVGLVALETIDLLGSNLSKLIVSLVYSKIKFIIQCIKQIPIPKNGDVVASLDQEANSIDTSTTALDL